MMVLEVYGKFEEPYSALLDRQGCQNFNSLAPCKNLDAILLYIFSRRIFPFVISIKSMHHFIFQLYMHIERGFWCLFFLFHIYGFTNLFC